MSVSPSWCDSVLQFAACHHGEVELKHSLYYFLQLHVNLLHLKILNVIIKKADSKGQDRCHCTWVSGHLPGSHAQGFHEAGSLSCLETHRPKTKKKEKERGNQSLFFHE